MIDHPSPETPETLIARIDTFLSAFPPEALQRTSPAIRDAAQLLRDAAAALHTSVLPAAAVNPPRRAGHDSLDWIDRAAADIRDLNPYYEQFEEAVADIIRAALTASAASPADQGWQPIETAPKDGAVLGWFPYQASPAEGGQVFVMRFNDDKYSTRPRPRPYWDASGWVWGVRDLRKRQPTHWMPLPPAPLARVPQESPER